MSILDSIISGADLKHFNEKKIESQITMMRRKQTKI